MPDSCVVIEDKCFDGCVNLRRVHISEQSELESIGRFAFRGCNVSDLFLPSGLLLGPCVFIGVKSFVAAKGIGFIVSDDCVFSHDRKILFHCFSSNPTFEVPDSVLYISPYCFAGSNVGTVVFGKKSKILDKTLSLCQAFAGSRVESVLLKQEKDAKDIANGKPMHFVENGILYNYRYVNENYGISATRIHKGLIHAIARNAELTIDASMSFVFENCIVHPESLECINFDSKWKDIGGQRSFQGNRRETCHD